MTKKILSQAMVLFIATIITVPLAARGTATMMGNFQSVSTDGPFDAMRNPAAMAFGGTSAGIYFFFSPWSGDDSSSKLNYMTAIISGELGTGVTAFSNSSLEKRNVMNQQFATAIKMSDMISLGIGVTAYFRDQENLLGEGSTGTFAALSVMPLTFTQTIKTRVNETEYNTFFSLGIKLTKSISMGYTFNFAIGNSDTDINANRTNNFPAPGSSDDEKYYISAGTISGKISAYFMYKTANHETGVNIHSGNYSWQDRSFKTDTGASRKFGFTGNYTDGASLIAGHYWRFTPLIALAFEAGASIPVKYAGFTYDDGTYTEKQTELNGLSILASLGMELNPLKRVKAGLGITYINTRGGNRSITTGPTDLTDKTTNYTVNAVNTTAGVSWEVFAGMEVNFTTSFIWYGIAADRDTIESHTGMFFSYGIESDTSSYQVDFAFSFVKRI